MSAPPAFSHEPPAIAPTRLDFDASRAPKNCNAQNTFLSIVEVWVPKDRFRDDAERRLVVRIYQSSTKGKQADVSLVNAQGVTTAERHQDFSAQRECHEVLWAVASEAAEILGAFEPPPPKQPIPCPVCPVFSPCPHCPAAAPALAPPLRLSPPTVTLSPPPYRSSVSVGAFVSSGIYSELNFGPYLLLGFVPSRDLPFLHVEFDGAWTSQMSPSSATSESIRLHSIPLAGSLCVVRGIVRFCGGLATTIFYANQSPNNDELHLMFGGNFRVGTELFVHGPFSIRGDVFGRFAYAQRRFGKDTMALDDPTPFAAGLAVMAGRSFD